MTMRNRPARTPGRRRGRAGSIVLDPCFQAGVTDYRDGRPPVEHGPDQKSCLGCRFNESGEPYERGRLFAAYLIASKIPLVATFAADGALGVRDFNSLSRRYCQADRAGIFPRVVGDAQ
jgi:hypothetical protein